MVKTPAVITCCEQEAQDTDTTYLQHFFEQM